MSRRVIDLMRKLFEPENLVLFVIGTTILSILGDGVYDLLNDAFQMFTGDTWVTRVLITSGAVVALAVIAGVIAVRVRRAEQATRMLAAPTRAEPHAGLVLLVGPNPTGPEDAALDHHSQQRMLRHCWLITPAKRDDDPPSSQAYERATRLAARLEGQGIDARVVTFADPYDITSAYLAVCQALDMAQHELADDRVIVDITGSTKVVTAGAALACRDRGQRIEYMVVPRNPTGEPISNRQPEAMKVLLDETSIGDRTDRKTYHRQHISTSDVPASAPRHEQQSSDGAETASPPELPSTDPQQQAPAIPAASLRSVAPLADDEPNQEPSRRDHAAADQPDTPDPTAP
jgi:hypothetical protein